MPVVTIGRQFGAGGTTVGEMLARELKADLLESRIIDEVAHRLQLPKEEVEAEDEQPGSLLHRLLMALGSASGEPMVQSEAATWNPPNVDPVFDTRRAVLEITQHVIQEARSEEHTSELQSHLNLVCRLLLEKKKKQRPTKTKNKQKKSLKK